MKVGGVDRLAEWGVMGNVGVTEMGNVVVVDRLLEWVVMENAQVVSKQPKWVVVDGKR